jgi:hypothetical protein
MTKGTLYAMASAAKIAARRRWARSSAIQGGRFRGLQNSELDAVLPDSLRVVESATGQ